MRHPKRGAAFLAIVFISAVMFSIMGFMVLGMTVSKTQLAHFEQDRLQAKYAAEAGLMCAQHWLWENPTWNSPAGGTDLPFDVNGDGVIDPGEGVDVEIPPCGGSPCGSRPLKATAGY